MTTPIKPQEYDPSGYPRYPSKITSECFAKVIEDNFKTQAALNSFKPATMGSTGLRLNEINHLLENAFKNKSNLESVFRPMTWTRAGYEIYRVQSNILENLKSQNNTRGFRNQKK